MRAARLARLAVLVAVVAAVGAGTASPSPTVVGGTPIQIQSAPWTVFIQYAYGRFLYQCTGSVLDSVHILTAAHCLFSDQGVLATPGAISVEAGVSNHSAPLATDREQDRVVGSFRVHPSYVYQDVGLPDDVAVLTLAAALDLSGPAVQAVALPPANVTYPTGATISTAGFGLQHSNDQTTGPLVSMTATVDPQGECADFSGTDLIQSTNSIVMCAVSPTSAGCQGDSGSGVVTTSGGAPMLIGVVDAGPQSCPVGGPNIYAYVGAPEILQFIQGNNQPPLAPRPSVSTSNQLTWGLPLVVGDTLTCTSLGWASGVTLSYIFTNSETGQVLQTGPSPKYVVPASGVGTMVQCEVAATNSGGTTVGKTIATPAIKAVPQVKIGALKAVPAVRGKSVVLRVVLTSPGGLAGTFKVCAVPPGAVAARTCVSTTKPFSASGSFPFLVHLKVKPNAPVGSARVAITATAGLSSAKATAVLKIAKA
jgi:hypothetical protein